MYGITKAWADGLRDFHDGELAAINNSVPIAEQFPISNTIGLPMANPPPPVNHSDLYIVNRFWRLGNPRGDENPFLLTMGILWFRVHQFWARTLAQRFSGSEYDGTVYREDEWLFNRARQFTIATHQHIVYSEWLPLFIPRRFREFNGSLPPYERTPGYSLYFCLLYTSPSPRD